MKNIVNSIQIAVILTFFSPILFVGFDVFLVNFIVFVFVILIFWRFIKLLLIDESDVRRDTLFYMYLNQHIARIKGGSACPEARHANCLTPDIFENNGAGVVRNIIKLKADTKENFSRLIILCIISCSMLLSVVISYLLGASAEDFMIWLSLGVMFGMGLSPVIFWLGIPTNHKLILERNELCYDFIRKEAVSLLK